MATSVQTPTENQLIVNLNKAGMNYYINSLFASDFIHDFGGTSNKRLNSLGKKVDEMRKMIGFDIQSGGRVMSSDVLLEMAMSNHININDSYNKSKSSISGFSNAEVLLPVPPKSKKIDESPLLQEMVTTETSESSEMQNTDIYIYSLLNQEYGNYDLLDPDTSLISEYETEKANEILNLNITSEEVEKLAMLHKSISYELNEYASEIILGITSYIGSNLITPQIGGYGDNDMGSVVDETIPSPHQTYNSIINASALLKLNIDKGYNDAIRERTFGDINNYESVVNNLKTQELELLDKIINEYIETYMNYYISETGILEPSSNSESKFWISGPLSDPLTNFLNNITEDDIKKNQFKQFFKLRAELNNMVKKYVIYPISTTRSGRTYQPSSSGDMPMSIDLIINKLLYFIFDTPYSYTYGQLTIEPTSEDDLTKNKILQEYNIENIRNNINYLLQLSNSNGRNVTNIEFIKNILVNGNWIPINTINPNLFAIQLLHSQYFEYKIKELTLDTLIEPTPKRRREEEEEVSELFPPVPPSSATKRQRREMEGGAKEEQTVTIDSCNKAITICNQIKDKCSEFASLSFENITSRGLSIINEILDTEHNEIMKSLFASPTQKTRQEFDKLKREINNDYALLTRKPKRNPLADIQRFSVNVGNKYEKIINKYCSRQFSLDKKNKIQEEKQKKEQQEEARRSESGDINKAWANKLTEYVARASLIITESVIDPLNDGNYLVNEEELNQIQTALNLQNPKDNGNWLFYLSTLLILLDEANYLKNGNNKESINRRLTENTGISNFNIKGSIDDKTITSARMILENIFPNNQIPAEGFNFSSWKANKAKTLINNAVTNWPTGLSQSNSFCPMSSINDAQPTCSSYDKEKSEQNIEIADMNVLFQDVEFSKTYNLRNIVKNPPYCRVIVEAYLGNGMQDTEMVGGISSKNKKGNLFISKDINMNISSQSDDKTLGAVNVLRTVIETITEMWSGCYASFPTSSPEQISDMCWDAMLTKYNYYNFLECSHLKALGDSTQELNGALKYGGYTSEGIRSYKKNEIYFNIIPDTTSGRITNRSNERASSSIERNFKPGNIVQFKPSGDAPRGTLSNDRQAGSRSIWLLTCLPDEVVNQEAIGGYSSISEFILAKATPSTSRITSGGIRLKGKKTRIIKKENYKTNKKKTKKYK